MLCYVKLPDYSLADSTLEGRIAPLKAVRLRIKKKVNN